MTGNLPRGKPKEPPPEAVIANHVHHANAVKMATKAAALKTAVSRAPSLQHLEKAAVEMDHLRTSWHALTKMFIAAMGAMLQTPSAQTASK